MSDETVTAICEIVAAALQRNYPDVTIEMAENMLDLSNAGRVLNIVLTGRGKRRR